MTDSTPEWAKGIRVVVDKDCPPDTIFLFPQPTYRRADHPLARLERLLRRALARHGDA